MGLAEHVELIGAMRNSRQIFVGKPERSGQIGRPGTDGKIILNRYERNRKKDVDWIHLTQDRDQWRALVMNLLFLSKGNFLAGCVTISFSRRTLLHGISKNSVWCLIQGLFHTCTHRTKVNVVR
jgi:hypothetical protein